MWSCDWWTDCTRVDSCESCNTEQREGFTWLKFHMVMVRCRTNKEIGFVNFILIINLCVLKHCVQLLYISICITYRFSPNLTFVHLVPAPWSIFGTNLISNKASKSTIFNAQIELFWCKLGVDLMHILVGLYISYLVKRAIKKAKREK